MKRVHQIILVITCALIIVVFAPNTQVDDTDDGLAAPVAMCVSSPKGVVTLRGRIALSPTTANVDNLLESVILLTPQSGTICQDSFGIPGHRLDSVSPLRC